VRLVSLSTLSNIAAGEMLYVSLNWQAIAVSQPAQGLAQSLRLYDASGQMLLQSDTPVNLDRAQTLALSIPAAAIPGDYNIALVLYAPETLDPFEATAADGTLLNSPTSLGVVTIQ
jgi:hypothetical protein